MTLSKLVDHEKGGSLDVRCSSGRAMECNEHWGDTVRRQKKGSGINKNVSSAGMNDKTQLQPSEFRLRSPRKIFWKGGARDFSFVKPGRTPAPHLPGKKTLRKVKLKSFGQGRREQKKNQSGSRRPTNVRSPVRRVMITTNGLLQGDNKPVGCKREGGGRGTKVILLVRKINPQSTGCA